MKYLSIMMVFSFSFLMSMEMEKHRNDNANYAYIVGLIRTGIGPENIVKFIRSEGKVDHLLEVTNSQGKFYTHWLHLIAAYGAGLMMNNEENTMKKEQFISDIFEKLDQDLNQDVVTDHVVFDFIRQPSECPKKVVFHKHTVPFCLLMRGNTLLAYRIFKKGFYLTPNEFDCLFANGKVPINILKSGIAQAQEYYGWRRYDRRYENNNILIPLFNEADKRSKKIEALLLKEQEQKEKERKEQEQKKKEEEDYKEFLKLLDSDDAFK